MITFLTTTTSWIIYDKFVTIKATLLDSVTFKFIRYFYNIDKSYPQDCLYKLTNY